MTTLKISLNTEQTKALREHAEAKGKTLEQDLLDTWWGRVQALLRYRDKITDPKATFREYHPRADRAPAPKRSKKNALGRPTSPKQEAALAASVRAKPVVSSKPLPEVSILPDDSPDVACDKAEKLAERDGYATEAEILKKFGRDTKGRKVTK